MANRRYYQFRYSLEPSVVDLYMVVTFGSSGAPTLNAAQSRGIASISRTSAGLYVIRLSDNYNRLLMAKHLFIKSSAPSSPAMYVVTDAVSSSSAPALTVQFNAAGSATDPASGEIVKIQISLKNSNA